MDLAELKFVVNTEQLVDAAKKIDALAASVSKVNKPITTAALESEKLAQAQAKTALAAAKVEEANTKAAIAAEKLAKAQTVVTDSSKTQMSILEKQQSITSYMSEGLSKGMATVMSYGKAAGLAADDLKLLLDTLQTQKKFSGDPFDKSLSGVTSLKNELGILKEVQRLYGSGVELTSKQVRELASDKERLMVKLREEGASLSTMKSSLRSLNSEYITLATSINKFSDAETQMIKQQKDAAKATAYLADADARLAAALADTNKALDKQATDALVKYEKALRQTGMSADEAGAKLAIAKKQFEGIAEKKQADRLQYLARAISVQMGDVGISLASGMNPLLVMIQQGDQIRGAIQQAGASGKELERAMAGAATQIATSFLQTGQAIGGFFVNAVKSAGKAIVDLPLSIATSAFGALTGNIETSAVAFDRLKVAAISFGKVGIVAIIATLAALGKGLYDVIKQEDALTTQLVLTGASLGVNTTLANQYAKSLNNLGINSSAALNTIAAMAKEGGFLATEITMVVTAANNLKFAGVAIEDTVKQFSKLKEKPVEALIEVAKNTGLIKPEVIALVSELEQQGKTSQAAAIAMKAYADVTIEQKDRLKEELNGFAVFMKTLGSSVANFFDDVFKNLFRKADPSEVIEKQIQQINDTLKGGFFVGGVSAEALKKQKDLLVEELMRLDQIKVARLSISNDNIRTAKALSEWQKLSVTNLDKEKKAELDIANIRKVGLEAKKSEAEIEKLIANYKEKNKPAKAPKTDAQKEAERLAKESEKYLSRISSLTNAATKEQENYTKAQKLALDIFSDPDFKNYPEEQRIKIANAIEQAHAEELIANELTKQRAIQKQIYDEYVKQQSDRDKLGIAAFDNSVALNKAMKEESDELMFQATLIGKTDEERKKEVKTRQAQLILAKELADIEASGQLGFGVTKEGLREEAYKRFAERTKNINTEIAQDFAKKQLEELDRISNGITDSIVTALIEGGEQGGKKLRALLEAELRKPVTVIVNAVVNAALRSVTGAGGGSNSLASNLLGKAASSISIGGTSLATMGQYFATGFMNTVAGTGAAAGATAGGAIGGASGMAMQIGAYGPYALAAAAVLNALGAFRTTKQVGGGISGTLGGTIDQYGTMRKSGTLFRGPDYFRQNQGTFAGNEVIQASFQQLKDSTTAMADTLKLSSAGVENFTKTIDISFDGLTNTQIEEKIAATLNSVNDELAALVLGAGATAEQLGSLYNSVMQQRYELETQLLELQGKTLELRERERAKIHEANQGLFDQIKALEDQKEANEKAAQANEKAAEAMQKLTNVTTTIVDEINRLRGVSTSKSGLESQFAILTAQARSGDLNALAQLPEVTKGLEQLAMSSAVNATDVVMARARLAQSLQDTLGYTGGMSSVSPTAVTSMSSIASVSAASSSATISANSSNQELLAALVVEVQGLRAEVRADVSHNAKTAKILERVNQDGESLTITTLV